MPLTNVPHRAMGEPKPAPVRLLLVDDDPEDAFLTRRAFQRCRLTNEFAHVPSAEAMFALLGSDEPRPDLILLDINMPGMGGLEALRRLRADAALRAIPVVVLSTSDDVGDVLSSYDIGANSYVTKPVSSEGLTEIARLFDEYWFQLVRLPGTGRRTFERGSAHRR